MKIFVTGTRGIPNIPGGVEEHCKNLYPILANSGMKIRISRRSQYVKDTLESWQGVELVDLYSPPTKSVEAIVHTFLSVWNAMKWKADIVHIHAVGPALLIPLARLIGLKVVFTNHGPDYDRQKWGRLAKSALKLGEYIGCKFANEIIVISEHIQGIVKQRTGRDSTLIFNGVAIPEIRQDTDFLSEMGLEPGKYLLAVARLVPEKGLHDLMDAHESLGPEMKLVIAGDADHETPYSQSLKARASKNPNIVMPGYVTGEDLGQLYSHAKLFVLPSYHEGLPISLLEALSYGLPAAVSDIPANTAVNLSDDSYFAVGDTDALAKLIYRKINETQADSERLEIISRVKHQYDWHIIADQTLAVYRMASSKYLARQN